MDEHTQRAILTALDRLPADQRRAAARAMLRLRGSGTVVSRSRALEVVGDMVRAQARTNARRISDARTDAARRVLVGARVPKADADRYRAAAAAAGISLYAWTKAALDAHADRPPDEPDRHQRRRPAKQRDQEQPRRYRPARRGA